MDAITDKTLFNPVRKPERRAKTPFTKERREAATRSRVSNGKDILANVDGRTAIARRFRDIASAIISDLGGATECSAALIEIIRRFAGTCVLAEQLEMKLLNGEPVNSAEHSLLASTMCRLAAPATQPTDAVVARLFRNDLTFRHPSVG